MPRSPRVSSWIQMKGSSRGIAVKPAILYFFGVCDCLAKGANVLNCQCEYVVREVPG
jgi:hypothetical protein